MPETRISKIQVRRGNIVDLPLLAAGEFGYAIDEQRLFIGNELTQIGTGNGLTKTFSMPNLSQYPAGLTAGGYITPVFYIDGVETSGVAINGVTAVFSTAPASGAIVTTQWNSEVDMKTAVVAPGEEKLTKTSAQGTATEFSFDKDAYSAVFMNYTLRKNQTAVITGTVQNPIVNIGDSLFINGTTVNFTTDASSNGYAGIDDIVTDINAANIPGIAAANELSYLNITATATDLHLFGSASWDVGIEEGMYLGTVSVEGSEVDPTVNAADEITVNGTKVKYVGTSVAELVTTINEAFANNAAVYAVEDGNRLRLYSENTDLVVDGTDLETLGIVAGTYVGGEVIGSVVATDFDIVEDNDAIVLNGETITFVTGGIEEAVDTINAADTDVTARLHPEAYYGVELLAEGTVPTVTANTRNVSNLSNIFNVNYEAGVDSTGDEYKDLDIRINDTLISFAKDDNTETTTADVLELINGNTALADELVASFDENGNLVLTANDYNYNIKIAAGDESVVTANLRITGISAENPAVVQTNIPHGFLNGDSIAISDIGGYLDGMPQLNNSSYTIANTTANTFELVGVDTTDYQAFLAPRDAVVTGLTHNPSLGTDVGQSMEINGELINFDTINPSSGSVDISMMIQSINAAMTAADKGIEAQNINNKIRLVGADDNITISATGVTALGLDFIESTTHIDTGATATLVKATGVHSLVDGSAVSLNEINGMTELNNQIFFIGRPSGIGTDSFYIYTDPGLGSPVNSVNYTPYADAVAATVTGSKTFAGGGDLAIVADSTFKVTVTDYKGIAPYTQEVISFVAGDTLDDVITTFNTTITEGVVADRYVVDGNHMLRLTANAGYFFELDPGTSGVNALDYFQTGTEMENIFNRTPSGNMYTSGATLLGFSVGTTEGLITGITNSADLGNIGEQEYISQGLAQFTSTGLIELGLTAGRYIRTAGSNIELADATAGSLAKLGLTAGLTTATDDRTVLEATLVQDAHSINITTNSTTTEVVFGNDSASQGTLDHVVETINNEDIDGVVASIVVDGQGVSQLKLTGAQDFELATGTGSALTDLGLQAGTYADTDEVLVSVTGTTFGQGVRDLQSGDTLTFHLTDSSTEVTVPLAITGTDIDDVVADINTALVANNVNLAAAFVGASIVISGRESFTLTDNQSGNVLSRIGLNTLTGADTYVPFASSEHTGTREEPKLYNGNDIVINGETITFASSDSNDFTPVTLTEAVDQINTVMVAAGLPIVASIYNSQLKLVGTRHNITIAAGTAEEVLTINTGNGDAGTPATATTNTPHELSTGDRVYVTDATINGPADGYYTVEVNSATEVALLGSTATGVWNGTLTRSALADLDLDTLTGTHTHAEYADAYVRGADVTPLVTGDSSTASFIINQETIVSTDTDFTAIGTQINTLDIDNVTSESLDVLKLSSGLVDLELSGTALSDLGIAAGLYRLRSGLDAGVVGTVLNPVIGKDSVIVINDLEIALSESADLAAVVSTINAAYDDSSVVDNVTASTIDTGFRIIGDAVDLNISTNIALDADETLLLELGIPAGTYAFQEAAPATIMGTEVDPVLTGCHGLRLTYGFPGDADFQTRDIYFKSGRTIDDVVIDINEVGSNITASNINGKLHLEANRAISIAGFGEALGNLGLTSGNYPATATVSGDDYELSDLTPGAITINGEVIGFTGTTLADVIADINNANIEGITASVSGIQQLQIEGTGVDVLVGLDESEANVKLGLTPGTYEASEGAPAKVWGKTNPDITRGEDFYITAGGETHRIVMSGNTLNSLVLDINNADISGVTASNNQNRLYVEGTEVDIFFENGQVATNRITDISVDGTTGAITVTALGHGFTTGQKVEIKNVGGMTELNDKTFFIALIDNDRFTLDGENGSNYNAFAPKTDAFVEGIVIDPTVSDNSVIGITTSAGNSRQVFFNDTAFGLDLDGIVDSINAVQLPGVTAEESSDGKLVIIGDSVDVTLSADETVAVINDIELTSTATVSGTEAVTIVPAGSTLTINGVRTLAQANVGLLDFVNAITANKVTDVEVRVTADNRIAMIGNDVDITIGNTPKTIKTLVVDTGVATIETDTSHNLITGEVVEFTGTGSSDYDGQSFTITVQSATHFTLNVDATDFADSTAIDAGSVLCADTALTTLGLTAGTTNKLDNIVTITALGHGFETGDRIRFAGVVGTIELDNNSYSVHTQNSDVFQLYELGTTTFVNGGTYHVDDFTVETNARAISEKTVVGLNEQFSINGRVIQPGGNGTVSDTVTAINATMAIEPAVGIIANITSSGNLILASSTTDIIVAAITEDIQSISSIELSGSSTLVATIVGHNFTDGEYVRIENTEGVTGLNNNTYRIQVLDTNRFVIVGADATAFVQYTTGGTVTKSPLVNLGILPGTYAYTPEQDSNTVGTETNPTVPVGYDFYINGVQVVISSDDSTSTGGIAGDELATLPEVVGDIIGTGINNVSADIVDNKLSITADGVDLVIARGDDSERVDISNITASSPVRVTAPGNEFENDDYIYIEGVNGMTELNDNRYQVANRGGVGYIDAAIATITANISNANFRNGLQLTITDDSVAASETFTLNNVSSVTSTDFADAGDYDNNSSFDINGTTVHLTTTSTVTGTSTYTYDSSDDKWFSINGVELSLGNSTSLSDVISTINTKMRLESLPIVAQEYDDGTSSPSDRLELVGTNVDITLAEVVMTSSASDTLGDLGFTAGTTIADLDNNSVAADINKYVTATLATAEVDGDEVKITLQSAQSIVIDNYQTSTSVDLETFVGFPTGTELHTATAIVDAINDSTLAGLTAQVDAAGRLVIDGLDTHDFDVELGSGDATVELGISDIAYVPGTDFLRATSIEHGLTDGEMITIEGVTGMTELNGNVYVVNVYNSSQFDLYQIIDNKTFNKLEENDIPSVEEVIRVDGTGFGNYDNVDPISATGTIVDAVVEAGSTIELNGTQIEFNQPAYDLESVLVDIRNAGLVGVTPSIENSMLKIEALGDDIVIAEDTHRNIGIANVSTTVALEDLGLTETTVAYVDPFIAVTGTVNDAIVSDGETLDINGTVITFTGTTGLTLQDVVDEITAELGSDNAVQAEVYTAAAHNNVVTFNSITDDATSDALVTTASPHNFVNGDEVIIDGAADSVDAIYTVVENDATSFYLENTSSEVLVNTSGTVQAAQYLRITSTGTDTLNIYSGTANTTLGLTAGAYNVDPDGTAEVLAQMTGTVGGFTTTAGQQIVINESIVEFADEDVTSMQTIADKITTTVPYITATVDTNDSTSTGDDVLVLTADSGYNVAVEASTQVTVVTDVDHELPSNISVEITLVEGLTAINDQVHKIDHAAGNRFVLVDFVIDPTASDYDSTYTGYIESDSTGNIKTSGVISLGLTEGTTLFVPNGIARIDAITSLGLVPGTQEHVADIDATYTGLVSNPEVLVGSDIRINGDLVVFADTDASGVVETDEIIAQLDAITSGDEIDAVGALAYDDEVVYSIEGIEVTSGSDVTITVTGHNFVDGDTVRFNNIETDGVVDHGLNYTQGTDSTGDDREFVVVNATANTFDLDGTDSVIYDDITELQDFDVDIIRHSGFPNDVSVRTLQEHNMSSRDVVRFDGLQFATNLNFANAGTFVISRTNDYEFSLNGTSSLDMSLNVFDKTDSSYFVITKEESEKVEIQITDHNLVTGDQIRFDNLDLTTELNYTNNGNSFYQVTVIDNNTFQLDGTRNLIVTLDSDSAVDSTDGILDDNTTGQLTLVRGGVAPTVGSVTGLTGTAQKKLTHLKLTSNNQPLAIAPGDVHLTVDIAGIDNTNAGGLVEIYTEQAHKLQTGDIVSFGDISTTGGLDNTGPYTITVTGDTKFTIDGVFGGSFPDYGNPSSITTIINGTTRKTDSIVVNGTTVQLDNKTINEAALEISLADITNVESRIVTKLVLSSTMSDIELDNFSADIIGLTIANNIATVSTSVGHGLQVGNSITIAGVNNPSQLNGTWEVATTTDETFTLTDVSDKSAWNAYTSGGTVEADEAVLQQLGFNKGVVATRDALTNIAEVASNKLSHFVLLDIGSKFVVNGTTVTIIGRSPETLVSTFDVNGIELTLEDHMQIISYGQDLVISSNNDSTADDIAIDGINTLTNPVQIKATAHGLETGNTVEMYGILGTTELNNKQFKVTKVNEDWITLDSVDYSLLSEYTGNAKVQGLSINPQIRLGDDIEINGTFVTLNDSTVNGVVSAINGANIDGVYARNNSGLELTGVGVDLVLGAGSTSRNVNITDITKANPCVVTAPGHALTEGMKVIFNNVQGMTALNHASNGGIVYTASNVTANTFELLGVNSIPYSDYIPYEGAQVTGANTNPVVFAGHGITINNEDVVFTGTDLSDVVTDINQAGIEGISAQASGTQLRIVGDHTDIEIAASDDTVAKQITGVVTDPANANRIIFTVPTHGLNSGEEVTISPLTGVPTFGTGSDYSVTKVDANRFSIDKIGGIGSDTFELQSNPIITGNITIPQVEQNANLFINGEEVVFNAGKVDSIVASINNANITGVTAQKYLNKVRIESSIGDLTVADNDGKFIPTYARHRNFDIKEIVLSNPIQVVAPAHNLTDGDVISLDNIVGTTALNDNRYKVSVVNSNLFVLRDHETGVGIDGGDAVYADYENVTNAEMTGTTVEPTVKFGSDIVINNQTINFNKGTLSEDEVVAEINDTLLANGVDYITADLDSNNYLVLTSDTSDSIENIIIEDTVASLGVTASTASHTGTPIVGATPYTSVVSDGETLVVNGATIAVSGTTLTQVVTAINAGTYVGSSVEADYELVTGTEIDIVTIDTTDDVEVTVTTATAHGLASNDWVAFSNTDSTFDYDSTDEQLWQVDVIDATTFELRGTDGGNFNWDSSATDTVRKYQYELTITSTGAHLTVVAGTMDLADIGLTAGTYYTGLDSVTGTVDLSTGTVTSGETITINGVDILFNECKEATLDNVIELINNTMDGVNIDITASRTVDDKLYLLGGLQTDIEASSTGGFSKAIWDITVDTAGDVLVRHDNHGFNDGDVVTIDNVLGMEDINGEVVYTKAIDSNYVELYTDKALTTPLDGSSYEEFATTEVTSGTGFKDSDTVSSDSTDYPAGFLINGSTIALLSTDTIADVASTINTAGIVGVRARATTVDSSTRLQILGNDVDIVLTEGDEGALSAVGLVPSTTTPVFAGSITRDAFVDLGLSTERKTHTASGQARSDALTSIGLSTTQTVAYKPTSTITIDSGISLNRFGLSGSALQTAHTPSGEVVHDAIYELGLSPATVYHVPSGHMDTDALMSYGMTAETIEWTDSSNDDVVVVEAETTLKRLGLDVLYDTFDLKATDGRTYSAYTGSGEAVKDALTDLGIIPGTYTYTEAFDAKVIGDVFGDNESVEVTPGHSVMIGDNTFDEDSVRNEVEVFFSGPTLDDVVRNINDTMATSQYNITASNQNGQLELIGDKCDITIARGTGTGAADLGFTVAGGEPLVFTYIPESTVVKSVLNELGLEAKTYEFVPWGDAIVGNDALNDIGLVEEQQYPYTRTNVFVTGSKSNPTVTTENFFVNGVLVPLTGKTVNEIAADITQANIPGIVGVDAGEAVQIDSTNVNIVVSEGTAGVAVPTNAVLVASNSNPANVAATSVLEINGTSVTLSGGDVDTVVADINAAIIPGVSATTNVGRLQITGTNTDINIGGNSSNVALGILGLTTGNTPYTPARPGTAEILGFDNLGETTLMKTVVDATEINPLVWAPDNININGIKVPFTGPTISHVVEAIESKNIEGIEVTTKDYLGVRSVSSLTIQPILSSIANIVADEDTGVADLGLSVGTVTSNNGIVNGTGFRPTVYGNMFINGIEVGFTENTPWADVVNVINTQMVRNGENVVAYDNVGYIRLIAGNGSGTEGNTVTVGTGTYGTALTALGITRDNVIVTGGATNPAVKIGDTIVINGTEVVFTGISVSQAAQDISAAVDKVDAFVFSSSQIQLVGRGIPVTIANGTRHDVTVTTSADNYLQVGQRIYFSGIISSAGAADGIEMLNENIWDVSEVISDTQFKVDNVALSQYTDYSSGGVVNAIDILPALGFDNPVSLSSGSVATGTVINPTATPGSAIDINGTRVVFSQDTTTLEGIVTDINAANIAGVTAFEASSIVINGTGVNVVLAGSGDWSSDLGLIAGNYDRVANVTGTQSEPTTTVPPSILIDGEEVFFTSGHEGVANIDNIVTDINTAVAKAIIDTGNSSNPSPLVYITANNDGNGHLQIRKTGGAGATTLRLEAGQTITTDILNAFGMPAEATSRGGQRIGQLRVMIEPGADAFSIDDQFNLTTNDIDVTFSAKIEQGIFTLTYENTEATDVTFNYTFDLWKT